MACATGHSVYSTVLARAGRASMVGVARAAFMERILRGFDTSPLGAHLILLGAMWYNLRTWMTLTPRTDIPRFDSATQTV